MSQKIALQQGSILITALAVLTVISLLVFASVRLAMLEQRLTAHDKRYTALFNAAEAGLRDAENNLDALSALPLPAAVCQPDTCLLDRDAIHGHLFDTAPMRALPWQDPISVDWYALLLPLVSTPNTLFVEVSSRAQSNGQELILRSVIALDGEKFTQLPGFIPIPTETETEKTPPVITETPRGRQSWTIVASQ